MNPIDLAVFHWLNAGPEPTAAVLALARFMSQTAPTVAVAGLLAAAVAGGPELRRSVLRAWLSMALAWATVSALRNGIHIPRPAELHIGCQWLDHGNGSGFPSHHAAGAFACCWALITSPALRNRRMLVALGLLIATSIAWSRVYLGVHFPKDVLVGSLIGCASAAVVAAAMTQLGDRLRLRRLLRQRRERRLASQSA